MPRRQIKDECGTTWNVWDVIPRDVLAGGAYDRRSADRPRCHAAESPLLDPGLEEGWLCFDAGTQRRRYAPIPPNWLELPDGVLRMMLDIANPVDASEVSQTRPSAAELPRPAADDEPNLRN
jgi:hypothetical protein